MLPVTKQKKLTTSATQRNKVIRKPLEETSFDIQENENVAGPVPNVSSELGSPATMMVCRVCLAMNVRMYHISEHKQSDMYKRVTGVEINAEDKFPQMLCWECVARLSSANQFMIKALKTHWILMKLINRSKLITMRDIHSIDRAEIQLQSTLSSSIYEVNHFNLHITDEAVKADINDQCYNETIGETEIYDHEELIDCTDHREQIICEEVDITNENFKIKLEQEQGIEKYVVMIVEEIEGQIKSKEFTYNAPIDHNCLITCRKSGVSSENKEIISENAQICNKDNVISVKEENMSNDKEAGENERNSEMSQEDSRIVDEMVSSEASDVTDQRRIGKSISATPLMNQKKNTWFRCKELKVVLEDIMLSKYNQQDSCKQLTANAPTKEYQSNECRVPTRERIIFEDDNCISETTDSTDVKETAENKTTKTIKSIKGVGNSSQTISTRNSNMNENISLKLNDIEDLKKLFICDFCNKPFRHRSTITRHIAKHMQLYKYNCTYCSYKTYLKYCLKLHINTKHTKSIIFNCCYCGFKAYTKILLNIHIKYNHTEKAYLNCADGSYKACRKHDLKNHINPKHTKATNFNCSYCSYKAYQKKILFYM